ncbi:TetR/AcrR family transcriptional regulator [Mycolicibacterium sp. 3033]|nr:TetR/AcrR family transcriptional regulator [Mycolicibacterium aurantiacum]
MTDRLLDGLAASLADRGYRDTTVADIVRHARTSKRTFYEHFASKEECLVELLRRNNIALIERITAAVDPESEWTQQIDAAVATYLQHIRERPAVTLSWIREAPALASVAHPLHRDAMHSLTDMLVTLTSGPGFRRAGLGPVPPNIALILLGGLRELTALVVEDGRDVGDIAAPAVASARALLGAHLN